MALAANKPEKSDVKKVSKSVFSGKKWQTQAWNLGTFLTFLRFSENSRFSGVRTGCTPARTLRPVHPRLTHRHDGPRVPPLDMRDVHFLYLKRQDQVLSGTSFSSSFPGNQLQVRSSPVDINLCVPGKIDKVRRISVLFGHAKRVAPADEQLFWKNGWTFKRPGP